VTPVQVGNAQVRHMSAGALSGGDSAAIGDGGGSRGDAEVLNVAGRRCSRPLFGMQFVGGRGIGRGIAQVG